jgi:hypothetical protein
MKVILTTLIFLSISAYFNLPETLWLIGGALFSLINLYFIKKLAYEILIANPKNVLKIVSLLFLKFPLLFGLSFSSLMLFKEISWAVLVGFTFVLMGFIFKEFFAALQNEKIEAV